MGAAHVAQARRLSRYLALCCMSYLDSRYTHDFQTCRCGASFVDGGDAYARVGARDPRNVVMLGASFPRRLEE